MSVSNTLLFKIGCLGMLSVLGLGAAYGHAGRLSQVGSPMFMKGQLYNMSTALGFFACSMITKSNIPLKIAIGAFFVGQALFIGPLYYTAITDKRNKYFTKLMPVGGSSLMLGWLSLIFAL